MAQDSIPRPHSIKQSCGLKDVCLHLKPKKGFINIYELDDDSLSKINVLWFDEPTEEWVDFVMSNRTIKNFVHRYDLVYGPVADDKVYAAFALYENDLLDKEGLIKELKSFRLVDQMLFHTEKSLHYLKFTESKEITI